MAVSSDRQVILGHLGAHRMPNPDQVAAAEHMAQERRDKGTPVDLALDALAADVAALARRAGVDIGHLLEP